ncbi:protein of unknown function [Burkholderia multivorans]
MENARRVGAIPFRAAGLVPMRAPLPHERRHIEFSVISMRYLPDAQVIHKLANKICGKGARYCVASIGNACVPRRP